MNRKKNIITLILTIVLIAIGINYLGVILRPTDTDGAYQQCESFHSLPDNSVEVIVYGSSHSYRGFDVRELYEKYGIGAYNYSWNWQRINTTKAFIKDSFSSQKPKVVIIESYFTNELLKDSEINAEIYYSRYLHDKKVINDYVHECLGNNLKTNLAFYMPLYAFHDNWIDISLKSLIPPTYNGELQNTMGFCGSSAVMELDIPDQNSKSQQSFSQEAIDNLDEIVNFCRENGADIVFYTTPFEWVYEYANAMKEYCNSRNCAYINTFDYFDEIGIDEKKDFADDGHLNSYGAIKVADYIGDFISKNYKLTDMRTIEGNVWEKNFK